MILLAQHIVTLREVENIIPPDFALRQAYLLNAIALNAIKVQCELSCPGLISYGQYEDAGAASNFTRFESTRPNRYHLYFDLIVIRLLLSISSFGLFARRRRNVLKACHRS